MKLEEYKEFNNLTYDQLAVLLDLKRSTVFNVCKGRGEIPLSTAKKIKEKTKGRVKFEDLLPLETN